MPSFAVKGSVALVTGTNKANGIGHAIVEALLGAGAAKVYATARKTEQLHDLVSAHPNQVVPVVLDATDLKAIAALSTTYPDITLVVNNCGFVGFTNSIDDVDKSAMEMQVNYIAPLAMGSSFAPLFAKLNGGPNDDEAKPSALVNINSITSFVNFAIFGTYSASKAASHSLTQAQRRDLKNTLVIGVYPGPIDTDALDGVDGPKETPSMVADAIIDALEHGVEDVFPDTMAKDMYKQYQVDAKGLEKIMAAQA